MPKSENKINTFKFKNFEELIKVDILIKKTSKLDKNTESHLAECIQKWTTLNCSLEFIEFRKTLAPKILTLNLLLFHEEEVVNILFENLEKCSYLSASSILDLLQSLVCDIRSGFLPYLERSFALITDLVERSADNPETLVDAFSCIAHIITFLERDLIRDLGKILPLVQPLLFHKKYYIRQFTAQSLAFLVRKSRHFKAQFTSDILGPFVGDKSSNHSDAIGKLMAACVRTKDGLYASGGSLFVSLLELVLVDGDDDQDRDVHFLVQCLDTMFRDLLRGLGIAAYRQIWGLILDQLCYAPSSTPNELSLLVMELFFKHAHNKTLALCAKDVIIRLKQLVRDSPTQKVVDISKLIIDKLPASTGVHEVVRELILSHQVDIEHKFHFVTQYISNVTLEMVIKNSLNTYLSTFITKEWLSTNPENSHKILCCLTNLVMAKYPISKENNWKDLFQDEGVTLSLFFIDTSNDCLPEMMLEIVHKEADNEDSDEMFWMVNIVGPHLFPVNSDKRFMDGVKSKLDRTYLEELTPKRLMKTNTILNCLVQLNTIQGSQLPINLDLTRYINLLEQYDYNSTLEPVLLEIILKSISVESDPPGKYGNLVENFIVKLRSPNHQSRLNSIRILQFISSGQSLTVCEEIEKFFELHESELVPKEREIFRLMDSMLYKSSMSEFDKNVNISYLFGLMHVQFTSLWKGVWKVLTSYYVAPANNDKLTQVEIADNEKILWPVIKNQLDCSKKLIESDIEMDVLDEFCCDTQKQYTMDKFYKNRNTNWLVYRLNVFKFLNRIPELADKKTAILSPILLAMYRDELCTNKSPRKTREETIVSLMSLYSKLKNIVGIHSGTELKNMFYKCLTSRNSTLQQAAFQVLVNYKIPELMNYKDRITAIVDKNKDELKQMSLSFILQSHREVILPIMLRIVVGQLKDNKNHNQKALIGYLLELHEREIGQLMSILFEGLKVTEDKCEIVHPDEDIQTISEKVRKSIEADTMPTFVVQSFFKTLQGVCGTLKLVLEGLLNKLTVHHLTMILRVMLNVYACCSHVKSSETQYPIPQLKPLRQICSNIVLFYFTKIEEFPWTDDLLNEVTGLIVTPQMDKLVEQNQSSSNTTIQLSLLWSEKEEFVTLITSEMFDKFIDLISKPKLNREIVGFKLVTIIYNMMQHAVTGRKHSDALQTLIERNLPKIIHYLDFRIKNLKMKKLKPHKGDKHEINETTTTRKELLMISIAVEYIIKSDKTKIDESIILDMINSILLFLYKSNSFVDNTGKEASEDATSELKEQLEVDFLRALDSIVSIVDLRKILPYYERFLGLFSRLRKRASRMVLSAFISTSWPRISELLNIPIEFNNLGEVAIKLNSWNENRVEEMDSEAISATVQSMIQTLKVKPIADIVTHEQFETVLHPNLWCYNLICQNCLFILSEVAEIGTRDDALDFMEAIIASISKSKQDKVIKVMFYENIWPVVRHGIMIKNESFRYSFIALVKYVIQSFGDTDRFRDISKLVVSEVDQMNFFENMLSLTTAFNSKGLRQLVRFLTQNHVSPVNLKEIILPLVLHRIELISQHYDVNNKGTLTHAERESLGSSFDALAAVAKQLPISMYQRLVTEHMSKLDRGFNVELVIKTLIGLLNGYNSDLDEDNHTFMIGVLAKLEKHLSKRTAGENRHKKAQKTAQVDLMDQKDAEWTLRGMTLQVPIALAIMNIVVKLPKKHHKSIITRIILRICDFLKAKEREVRHEAGNTLFKIVEIVNEPEFITTGEVRYLGFVITTVKNCLDRGFQKHVGLHTCHRVLQRLNEKKIFDRLSLDDSSIRNMSQLYFDELFGSMATEKAERSTAEKGIVEEAKKVKAFDGFRLIGSIISKTQLLDFLKIIVDASKEIRSKTNLQKFQQIFEGLQSKGGIIKNPRLDYVSLFTVSKSLIDENISALFTADRESQVTFKTKKKSAFDDMHIYKPAVRLDGDQEPIVTKTSSSSHLIINCGLNFMHGLCKMYSGTAGVDLCAMLDPMVDNVIKILDTIQYKLIMFSAVKCLKEIIRINPPSLVTKVDQVCDLLFRIHDKNFLFSDVQDILSENLTTVFNKTITQFIQRPDVHLNASQYKILLLGVQVDSLNNKRQMTSFNLLRAIIDNRIKEPTRDNNTIVITDGLDVQLIDIIKKVRNIALLSSNERSRTDARSTFGAYIKNYRQSKESLQENIIFLLKQLASVDEDGQLSACLIIQNIFREYNSVEIDADTVSPYVIACLMLAMQRGVTDKVEKVFSILINQVMHIVSIDKQHELCAMVFDYINKFELDNIRLRIAFYLISDMLKILSDESRVSLSKRLVNILLEKLPSLIEYANRLNKQLAASKGVDADLMIHLEKVAESVPKKRRLDVAESDEDNENDDTRKDGHCGIENSEELSVKLTTIMENVNGVLLAMSNFVKIDHANESDVAVLLYLMESGMENHSWDLILDEIMRQQHSVVRLNAAKNVIQPLLKFETDYESKSGTTFVTKEIINKIVVASFSQWKNDRIEPQECDTVLVNLLLLWNISLQTLAKEDKIDICRRIVNSANHVANKELVDGKSMIRRVAVLKFLAGISKKTSVEDLESLDIERNILWMYLREEKQAQDENEQNKKKKTFKRKIQICSETELMEWKNLVVSVGDVIRTCLGEEKCKRLSTGINKQKASDRLKRKIDASALSISNPEEALRKKLKKPKRS